MARMSLRDGPRAYIRACLKSSSASALLGLQWEH
jgi:hypothetical protein